MFTYFKIFQLSVIVVKLRCIPTLTKAGYSYAGRPYTSFRSSVPWGASIKHGNLSAVNSPGSLTFQ